MKTPPVLAFCRKNLKDFTFSINERIPENSEILLFEFYGLKVKIKQTKEAEGLCFGKYGDFNVAVKEAESIDDNFTHIMSSSLSEDLRTVAGIGLSVMKWHRETKFCGKCGTNLVFHPNERNAKICENCGLTVFPRLNPAIIVAVKKEDKILLTRKSEWKKGRYGLVAGFIEYGETIEEAAEREILEETGIKVKNIRYITSQFWPFPYQIMIGLEAEYLSGNIQVELEELEEARWIKLSDIKENMLPPSSSIARFLILKIMKNSGIELET